MRSSGSLGDRGDPSMRVGSAYTVRGVTYTPYDDRQFDALGYATYYGGELAGRPTALGERFRPSAISAAHTTLPLPSYVEVTALDTGKTILVRVNDRGPFVKGRLIDLSEGAARELGIRAQGVAPVRVRRVFPSEEDKARLRKGGLASARPTMSPRLLAALRQRMPDSGQLFLHPRDIRQAMGEAPRASVQLAARSPAPAYAPAPSQPARPMAIPEPQALPMAAAPAGPPTSLLPAGFAGATLQQSVAAQDAFLVELASFARSERAHDVAADTGGFVLNSRGLYQVRLGPFQNAADASKAVESAAAKGYSGGRIVRK